MITTTVHEAFALQAARTPDAVALWYEGRPTSYAELDAASERIAVRLRRSGARPGALVGVHLERGVQQVAAVIGVLKSGAGFMMLDTTFPAARLQRQLAETAPVAVITSRNQPYEGSTEIGQPYPLLLVEECDPSDPIELLDRPGSTDPTGRPRLAGPDDLACVMFTSGSTGHPKAVAGNHRSLVVSVSAAEFGRLGPGEIIIGSAPVSWDAFVLELFSALLFGGTVVLQPGQTPDPTVIADLVVRHRVSTLFASASLLNYLVDEHPEIFDRLTTVLTGGDVASPTHARRLLDRSPRLRLVNGYGPVETMIAATVHEVTAADARRSAIPVGRDTLGKRVEVLDAELRPVPAGGVGELYVSGAGLADGYLNQTGTTAVRFVARPGGAPGERMYRTGDLGRRDADGVVHYLGRHDAQVKLRGFRLELGEIEEALVRHAAVSRAAARLHDTPTGPQLVGYVVPVPGVIIDTAAVREHVVSVLPRHAVPSQVLALPELPRTSNGKLDRDALPAPETTPFGMADRPDPSPAPIPTSPPADPEEEQLASDVADLLGRATVGRDEDFFALGGHSLLAARLVTRVRARTGRRIDVRDVFAHPTVATLSSLIARAGWYERGVLTPPARPRPADLPLSPGQQRMLFGYSESPARAAGSHVTRAIELRGPVDHRALQAALTDVVGRHEALRTVYPVDLDGPHQHVLTADRAGLVVPVVPTSESALDAAVHRLAGRLFDLGTELPLRATLVELGPEHAVLVLVLHHIACDGWSMRPLTRDLAAAYTARSRGAAPDWAPLPIQYGDYAAWQRDLAGSDQLEPSRRFWAATLAGLATESGLPPTRALPAGRSHHAVSLPLTVDAPLHRAVTQLAHASGATAFMVVHAALALLLNRLGAGTDLAIGTPVAGRDEEGLDDVIGFFVNTVVLRTDTSGDPSVRDLVRRVRDTDLAALAHADLGFERVVETLNPDRRTDRHPLFQVMLAVRDDDPELELPGVTVSTRSVPSGIAQFDLTVDLVQRHDSTGAPGGLVGDLEYAAELYDHAVMTGLAERLPRLLRAMVADPDAPVSRLDVLSTTERSLLTSGWRGPVRPAGPDCLADLVAGQVAQRPDAVAVVADGQRLSYAELDRRAASLAAALIAAGAGPDRVVAVALPRSADLVVATLAVVMAGAAFFLIDPSEPDPRTSTMLAQTNPVCAVVGSAAPAPLPTDLVRIEVAGAPRPAEPDAATAGLHASAAGFRPRPQPDDLAYVVFTSGSTGAPKGVAVPHAAIVNCLQANRDWDPLAPEDRVLFKAAVTFDVAVREIFWPLVQGATVVVAAPGGHRDPAYLAALIRREAVTTVDFVPSMLPHFLDLQPTSYPTLRRITCGGEALAPAVARRCHDLLGLTPQNFYGPTEAAVEVTSWRWSPDQGDESSSVPLGRPGVNTELVILDDRLEPSPIGTVGDLYLGGAQLARGYLGRPDLTAERFVAHPYGSPGARLYRTGDRARWRADGVCEFAGRDDAQVKVNGLRVELGEIAAILRSHPAVSDCAVVDHRLDSGHVRLVAYAVTTAADRAVTSESLRRHLLSALPRALVPTVTMLDALPLTRHGKLDRAALPALDRSRPARGRPPANPREQTLCAVFARVLGTSEVGVDDNFFDLGGHSLLATRVIAQARSALGVEIDMAALFEFPTAAGLAAHLSDSPRARPPLRARSARDARSAPDARAAPDAGAVQGRRPARPSPTTATPSTQESR